MPQPNPQLNPPTAPDSDTRKFVEDILSFLDTLKRRWWLVGAAALASLALAGAHVSRLKPVHSASARLLILQQSGQVLKVTENGDPLRATSGGDEDLSTHVMIVRSPAIVERAVASSGLEGLTTEAVIDRLTVDVPEESAKVLQVSYRGESSDEAVRVVEAVITSYDLFLKENYRKTTSEVISLIVEAKEELGQELRGLERDYLEFRQNNPAYTADQDGPSLYARRIDLWDQAANQAMIRALQLRSQLELGRKLAGEGSEVGVIATVIGQLGGASDGGTSPSEGGPGASTFSFEGLQGELATVELQRLTTERLLEHLRARRSSANPDRPIGDAEIAQVFYADPGTAALRSQLDQARASLESVERLANRDRHGSDPAAVHARRRVRELDEQLGALWRQRRPAIQAQLEAPEEDAAIGQAESELLGLRARESTLRERWEQVRSDQLRRLREQEAQLAELRGPDHPKVQQVREQIARIEGTADDARDRPGQGRAGALLDTIQQSLEAIEAIRAEYQARLDDDRSQAKKTEIDLLTEANLRGNLDRQRALFNSVVDQLKQAQLVSDFGSVNARILDPPAASTSEPKVALILAFALVAGCGLGTGVAFVADLLDARLRSPAEMRRVLDLSLLGMIPRLVDEPVSARSRIGLISHVKPRSLLAESYRSIRTNLQVSHLDLDARVILVTSPYPGDGKTTTSSNLAISLAHAGRKVLLIDADLRNPSQHALHDLPRGRGLVHVLKGLLPLHRVVQETSVEGLDLLAAGPEVHNPAELLASDRLAELLDAARLAYDVIIVDSSPLLAVTDPLALGASADGIVLVARVAEIRRCDAERTSEMLRILKTPVLGVVVNGVTQKQTGYGYKLYVASGSPEDA